MATRACAYADQLRFKQYAFESLKDYARWRERGRSAFRKALAARERVLWLTGNHLGALPVYDELADRDDVLVVQFDAHLDIHHFADYSPEPSHGNFLLHCAGKLPPLINVGHRELLLTPDYVSQRYPAAFAASDLALDPGPALKQLASSYSCCQANLYRHRLRRF